MLTRDDLPRLGEKSSALRKATIMMGLKATRFQKVREKIPQGLYYG
jgi:hypothetical protein